MFKQTLIALALLATFTGPALATDVGEGGTPPTPSQCNAMAKAHAGLEFVAQQCKGSPSLSFIGTEELAGLRRDAVGFRGICPGWQVAASGETARLTRLAREDRNLARVGQKAHFNVCEAVTMTLQDNYDNGNATMPLFTRAAPANGVISRSVIVGEQALTKSDCNGMAANQVAV